MNKISDIDHKKFDEILVNRQIKDEILLYILVRIANKMCVKSNNDYIFDSKIETPNNEEFIVQCYNLTQKIVPYSNPSYMTKCKKKVYVYVKHLCSCLEDLDIIFTTAQETILIDGKKSVKTKYHISGLL